MEAPLRWFETTCGGRKKAGHANGGGFFVKVLLRHGGFSGVMDKYRFHIINL
jgi:hypothetical protein